RAWRLDRHQRRRGDPAGQADGAGPYHRDHPGRWRCALSEQAVQSGIPAQQEPAGSALDGLIMTALLFRDDSYLTHCDAVITAIDERGFQTDRTVFYPLGGGQPGDIGRFVLENGETVEITDTVKGDGPEGVIHRPGHGSAALKIGLHGKLEIDWARRHRLMRMHTCLHLLSALVPFPVTGGQVGDGKGRLDFDMADSIPDKETLTAKLNELIPADHKVPA